MINPLSHVNNPIIPSPVLHNPINELPIVLLNSWLQFSQKRLTEKRIRYPPKKSMTFFISIITHHPIKSKALDRTFR